MKLTHLDLFSGIGGFALAAQWAGFHTVGFSEVDSFCCKVLKKHWPDVPNWGDVRNVYYDGKLDLITGGFPCQPFSVAGKKKGNKDDRHLWPYFRQIIRNHHPRFVVAENVTGIVNMELDAILDDLEACGYAPQTFVIPACAVGAPHRRERVWIVAYSNRERCDYGFDHPHWRHVQDNWKRDVEALQTEWLGFFPNAWKTFNFQEWLGFTTNAAGERLQTEGAFRQPLHTESASEGQAINALDDTHHAEHTTSNNGSAPVNDWQESKPPIPGVDDGIPYGLDRNKALGNAIVPQVVYPILRLLALMGGVTHG